MQLRYDEDFVEAAVVLCASGRRKGVPSLQITRFYREREKLYGIPDPDDRNAAFFKVHLEWFRNWGLEDLLLGVLKEFPLLPEKLALLAVRKARGRNDDGAELYVNETGRRSAVLSLRPESFQCDATLQDSVRHEFMHLHDMVDPEFSYSPVLNSSGPNPFQDRLSQERYRLLWDIAIDGRLAAAGHKPSCSLDQHAAAFARGYSFWPVEKQLRVFDGLWLNRKPRHADLLALIADPRGLRDANRPEAGACCPLCGFPTFAWSDADQLAPDLIAAIIAEFPLWTKAQGVCARCVEAYQANLSLRTPPPEPRSSRCEEALSKTVSVRASLPPPSVPIRSGLRRTGRLLQLKSGMSETKSEGSLSDAPDPR